MRAPTGLQHNSRSELLIQELRSEETDLQQEILARGCRSNDPEDKGYEPSSVPRGCTDVLWFIPFLVCVALAAYAVHYAVEKGDLNKFVSLPDRDGVPCGQGHNRGKPFLYFCMQKDSQHIMEGNDKRLDMTTPICVGICPGTYNTSSRCYLPLNHTYAWVQDYPTQPFIGLVCRPSYVYTKAVYDQFQRFVDKAPPIATMSIVIRAWNILLWAGMVALIFSYFFIAMLSRSGANCIVLTGVLVVVTTTGATAAFLFWCANPEASRTDACGANDNQTTQDFIAGIGLLLVGAFFLCLACQMSAWMETAVKLIQWSCKCILHTPSLFLAPPIIVLLRGLTVAWGAYVGLLIATAGIKNYTWARNYAEQKNHQVDVWGHRQFHISYEEWMCLLGTVLMNIWVQGIITCWAEFVTVYTSQSWYFSGGMSGQGSAPPLAFLRACWVATRYHMGSIIGGGLKIMLALPFHWTFGWMDSAIKSKYNPVGYILGGCCDCCLGTYRRFFASLSRHAFLDVSLQATPFHEAADHVLEILAQESTAFSLLNGASWLLQIVGLGVTAVIGHVVVAVAIQTDQNLHNVESPSFVQEPEMLCLAGAALALFVGFPFMSLFDIVSDVLVFCRTMQKMRVTANQPHSDSLVHEVMDRACASRINGMLSGMVGCHCGGRDRPNEEEWGLLSWSPPLPNGVPRRKESFNRPIRIPSAGQRY